MDDRNKDLPLVVPELLIEMHGVNKRLGKVELAVNRMAEIMLVQQQDTNRKLDLMLEGNKANTMMLIEAFREEAAATRAARPPRSSHQQAGY